MSGMDVLRERIADTVRAHRPGASIDAYRCECGARWTSAHVADAVIAALGLVEKPGTRLGCADGTAAIVNGIYVSGVFGGCPEFQMTGTCPHCVGGRHWETPWERIEEDQ